VAVKPNRQDRQVGISIDIQNDSDLVTAFDNAVKYGSDVLIEEMLTGMNYRVLVIDGVIISALAREHAHVVGDGENTIAALVDRANHDPRRGLVNDTPLFTIELNAEAEANLVALGYSKDTVPDDGEHVILRYFPSISRGGTAQDVTDDIHPEVCEAMLLGVQAFGLDLAVVDYITPDISKPPAEVGGGFCEINCHPALFLHFATAPRDVARPLFNMLFPDRRPQHVPIIMLLILGLVGPMVLVLVYSFMPRGSFSIRKSPSIGNYVDIIEQDFYLSFSWSLLLAVITVIILLAICYPLALAIKRVSGRRANLLTLIIVAPLFVAENIRLQGWVLFLDKKGVLDGALNSLFGLGTGGLVNNVPSVIFGIVYIYLPFMLFPILLGLANVPQDAREAANDLGASRWRMFRDIELPLAMPGIMIGGLLCFVLSLGAFSEAKFLGKGVIVTIAQDIESAFTFGQNWPRGSALSVILIVIAGSAVFLAMRRINLERMLAKR